MSRYVSYPPYEEITLEGYLGMNVALIENVEKGALMYLYKTPYGLEEDTYFFGKKAHQLLGTSTWMPMQDHPEYRPYYNDCPERHIVMNTDLNELCFYGPRIRMDEPEEREAV